MLLRISCTYDTVSLMLCMVMQICQLICAAVNEVPLESFFTPLTFCEGPGGGGGQGGELCGQQEVDWIL